MFEAEAILHGILDELTSLAAEAKTIDSKPSDYRVDLGKDLAKDLLDVVSRYR